MGHKTLKEHYRIVHIVHTTKQGICIGSPYISDIIVLGLDGSIIKGDDGRSNDDLKRYMAEFRANPEKLREVVASRDVFAKSIPVYTYEGGEIIEEACEETGWPNVTHAGHLMYENTFSTDKEQVVKWAKRNAQCGINMGKRRMEELKKLAAEIEAWMKRDEDNLAKLDADYPQVKGEIKNEE